MGMNKALRWELVAMVAVITITSYHVSQYMSAKDFWAIALVQGVVLGFCNFLMAHNIFRPGSTSRLPSFVGLVFFALVSVGMQYTYFSRAEGIGGAYLLGVNLEALILGMWAPTAEIILGWVHAANSRDEQPATEPNTGAGGRILNALVTRAEQSLSVPAAVQAPTAVPVHVNALQLNSEHPAGEQRAAPPRPKRSPKRAAVGVTDLSIPFDPEQVDTETKREFVHGLIAAGREFNKTKLAEALGIGRTTLHNWTKDMEKGAAMT